MEVAQNIFVNNDGMHNYNWINKIEFPKAEKFHSFINNYCIENNIPIGFNNFLHHGNGYVSETYKYLISNIVSKYYLVNSKSFRKFYFELDVDFRNDILNNKEYQIYLFELKCNIELIKFLRNLMGLDSIL